MIFKYVYKIKESSLWKEGAIIAHEENKICSLFLRIYYIYLCKVEGQKEIKQNNTFLIF